MVFTYSKARKELSQPRRRTVRYRRARVNKRLKEVELKVSGVEYNFLDTSTATAVLAQAPVITQLTNMAQGNAAGTRNGDSIVVTAINLNLMVRATGTDRCQFRVMIIHDKQTNGAIFTAANVLLSAAARLNIYSPYNLGNKFRFRVLFDKNYNCNFDNESEIILKEYIKCNIKLRYSTNAGDITDLLSSSLGLMTSGSTALCDIEHIIRIRYIDS